MRILTAENKCVSLNDLPETLTEEINFSILDNSNPSEPDFFFESLMFLETFNSPATLLQIGEHQIAIPSTWKVLIGDPISGHDLEVLSITSIYHRGFDAFIYNPISSFRPSFEPIDIANVYNDVKWYFPKTRNNQLLTIPLTCDTSPLCAYFINDISRQCEQIDYSILL